MVTRLATQQSLFRRFAPYGFTLYIGETDRFRYKQAQKRACEQIAIPLLIYNFKEILPFNALLTRPAL